MTTQYAGLDIWSETIDHVTDDDVRDASSYAISAIGLADRTRYLKNRGFYSTPAFGVTPYTNTGTYRINGQIIFTSTGGFAVTYSAAQRYARAANLKTVYANPTHWLSGPEQSTPTGDYTQITAVPTTNLVFEFDIPSNCVLKRLSVRIRPDPGHVSYPNVLPEFETYLVDTVAGTTTLLVDGNGVDAPLTLAEYNALHVISVDLSIVYNFDASRHKLFMAVRGESGVGSIDGLVVHVPTVEYDRTIIGEEFGEVVP